MGEQEWNQTYGRGRGLSLIQNSDGNYIIGGGSRSGGLRKVNNTGEFLWNATPSLGTPGVDFLNSVTETSDGGYAFAGGTSSSDPAGDFLLVKSDVNGTKEWTKTFGGSSWDNSCCDRNILQTSDGGFILVGETTSFGAGGADGWVLKTDNNGSQLWNQTFGGPSNDRIFSLFAISDNEIMLAGMTESKGNGFSDIWIIKAKSSTPTSTTTSTTTSTPTSTTTPKSTFGFNSFSVVFGIGLIVFIRSVKSKK